MEHETEASRDPAAPAAPAPSRATLPLFVLGPWRWGTLAVALALVLAVSGLVLLFFYRPIPGEVRPSLVDLREVGPFGLARDVHHWAAHGLVIAAWLHVFRVFLVGSYRRPRGWTATVGLLALVTAMAVTGVALGRDPGAGTDAAGLLRLWVLHCVVLPGAAAGLVFAWWRRRRRRP